MTTTRRLGKTDLEVPPIGLGTWQFSGGHGLAGRFWEAIPQDRIDQVVAAALHGGVRLFDTAEMYGGGESERRLSAALQLAGMQPGEVTIATKWSPLMRTANSIAATIDERLHCLTPFAIDLYQVHQPYGLSSVEKEMDAMADLVEAKKIRFAGVSNYSAWQMQRAHATLATRGLMLASNQVRFNLLDRSIEHNGVLSQAKALGVSIIAWSPLAQGLLTGRFHEEPIAVYTLAGPRSLLPAFHKHHLDETRPLIDALREIGLAHCASVSQVALAWTVQFHGEMIFAIPGATRRSQAVKNAAALELKLSAAELDALDRISQEVIAAHDQHPAPPPVHVAHP